MPIGYDNNRYEQYGERNIKRRDYEESEDYKDRYVLYNSYLVYQESWIDEFAVELLFNVYNI